MCGAIGVRTSASTLSVPLSLWSYPGTYQVNIEAVDANGNPGLWNTSLSFAYAPNLPNPTSAFTSTTCHSLVELRKPWIGRSPRTLPSSMLNGYFLPLA